MRKSTEHITAEEHVKFKNVLSKYKEVFDCKIGLYPHEKFHLTYEKFHLTLKLGAKPVHQ